MDVDQQALGDGALANCGQCSTGQIERMRTNAPLVISDPFMAADPSVGNLGGAGQGSFQTFGGKPLTGLDVGGGALIDRAPAQRLEEGLDGVNHVAAGGPGFEHLPDEAFESQAQAKDPLATAGTLVLGSQEMNGEKVAQLLTQGQELQGTQGLGGALAEGGELGAQFGEERGG